MPAPASPVADPSVITFQVTYPDGVSPYINLDQPEPALEKLRGRDEIVVRAARAVVVISYPVREPVEFTLEADSAAGFSRAGLCRAISRAYHQMFEEEERSAHTKTLPKEQRKGLSNRNRTDGRYGIWGHDLGDLDLHRVTVQLRPGRPPLLKLGIDS